MPLLLNFILIYAYLHTTSNTLLSGIHCFLLSLQNYMTLQFPFTNFRSLPYVLVMNRIFSFASLLSAISTSSAYVRHRNLSSPIYISFPHHPILTISSSWYMINNNGDITQPPVILQPPHSDISYKFYLISSVEWGYVRHGPAHQAEVRCPAQVGNFSADMNCYCPPLEQDGWDVWCLKVVAVPRDQLKWACSNRDRIWLR